MKYEDAIASDNAAAKLFFLIERWILISHWI